MYYIDYHVHSHNSFDSKTTIEEMCNAALANGINELCFTEHFSINPVPTYGYFAIDKYNNEIKSCIDKFYGKLIIKKGLEVCEPHINSEKLNETIKDFELDFIIGSVHNVNMDKLRNFIKDKDNFTAYDKFFDEVYNMVKTGDFDVVGHFDLLKRYAFNVLGNYNFNEHREKILEILKIMVDRNIGLEVNTSGIRGKIHEVIPKVEIIKNYKDLGGEIITVGSDAHDCDGVGKHINLVLEMIKDSGFKYVFTFDKRNPKAIKI